MSLAFRSYLKSHLPTSICVVLLPRAARLRAEGLVYVCCVWRQVTDLHRAINAGDGANGQLCQPAYLRPQSKGWTRGQYGAEDDATNMGGRSMEPTGAPIAHLRTDHQPIIGGAALCDYIDVFSSICLCVFKVTVL